MENVALYWMLIALAVTVIPELGSSLKDLGSIGCETSLENIIEKRNIKTSDIVFECPGSCLGPMCRVTGSNPYHESSSLCCAALHSGIFANKDGGRVAIHISRQMNNNIFHGSTCNGVKSQMRLRTTFVWFQIENSTLCFTTPVLPVTTTMIMPSTTKVGDESSISTSSQSGTVSSKSTYHGDNRVITKQNSVSNTTNGVQFKLEDKTNEISTIDHFETHMINTTVFNSVLSNNDQQYSLGSSSLAEMIGIIIGVFVAGSLSTFLLIRVWKVRRKIRKQWQNQNSSIDRDNCVCYYNLNSSRQGLLHDPETCERPCSIRKPILDVGVPHTADEQRDSDQRQTPSNCVEVVNEDQCGLSCSGTCNSESYDF
ncbi:uncharacterized protein LOC120332860 [Styela clava]